MRPIPFPEPYRSQLAALEGTRIKTWAAPDGDLLNPEVAPTEAITYMARVAGAEGQIREGQWVTSVMIKLEDGDLENLAETGMFEFGVWGGALPVFFFVPMRAPSIDEWREIPHEFDVVELGDVKCKWCGFEEGAHGGDQA